MENKHTPLSDFQLKCTTKGHEKKKAEWICKGWSVCKECLEELNDGK